MEKMSYKKLSYVIFFTKFVVFAATFLAAAVTKAAPITLNWVTTGSSPTTVSVYTSQLSTFDGTLTLSVSALKNGQSINETADNYPRLAGITTVPLPTINFIGARFSATYSVSSPLGNNSYSGPLRGDNFDFLSNLNSSAVGQLCATWYCRYSINLTLLPGFSDRFVGSLTLLSSEGLAAQFPGELNFVQRIDMDPNSVSFLRFSSNAPADSQSYRPLPISGYWQLQATTVPAPPTWILVLAAFAAFCIARKPLRSALVTLK
jgi:hypothetical protein